MIPPLRVTVFGSARVSPESSEYRDAQRLGAMLAEAGHTVLSGGYAGAMEAVSRGAREAGGQVVGVTMIPWAGRLTPNQYLSEERAVESLFARIEALIESDCLIALPGGAGTLGEVALAWNLRQTELIPRKPVILVGEPWERMVEAFRWNLIVADHDLAMLRLVHSVEDAVAAMEESEEILSSGAAG
ncbi:MAG TPA: LOG family protein [Chloroflexota bacterium]|nr:LOG family protein [Chloroflexota bacterium]